MPTGENRSRQAQRQKFRRRPTTGNGCQNRKYWHFRKRHSVFLSETMIDNIKIKGQIKYTRCIWANLKFSTVGIASKKVLA